MFFIAVLPLVARCGLKIDLKLVEEGTEEKEGQRRSEKEPV
jgi:hypothetical protein